MQFEIAEAVRTLLGRWHSYEAVTDAFGVQAWHLHMINGLGVAVKAADGGTSASLAPAREAAVIRAAGPVAGKALAWGRLDDGGSWTAAPWWPGTAVHHHFAAFRQAPADPGSRQQAAAAAARAAAAVADLHATGWAHGNLQPDHILLAASETRLLSLAQAHGSSHCLPDDLAVPYSGGSRHLLAPELDEQFRDRAAVVPTAAADVYALAGTLVASMTGTWPRLARSRNAPVGWSRLDTLLATAMAVHPGDRPTATELADELSLLAQDTTTPTDAVPA